MLDAQSRTYTFHLPGSALPSGLESYVTYSPLGALTRVMPVAGLGGWEVTVALDIARCEVHCIYKRKRDSLWLASRPGLLLPPITEIRVFPGSASPPITWVVDPAGLGFPSAVSNIPISCEVLCMPAKRIFTTPLPLEGDSKAPVSHRLRPVSTLDKSGITAFSSAPLRI